ncbi:MAG TPA: hypothetical protein VMV77_03695 [Bacteroidales bacterium]|nr:hypothetical protein [Bacteroidales bacterium]
MQQIADIERYFKDFFGFYIPDRIIEFGTGAGDFIAIIRKLGTFDIYSYDLYFDYIIVEGIIYDKIDIFENEQSISDLFKTGNILLLCDNGDKIREVCTFAKYLKTGDVIMAHDYADDRDSFIKNNYWRTCEIVFENVEKALADFKPFHHDLMIQAGWMSYQKL